MSDALHCRVTISVASGRERGDVIEYISEEFERIFGSIPPVSDVYFQARCEGNIVGSTALDLGAEGRCLPFEGIYHISKNTRASEILSMRSLGAQFGRWRASVPGISRALVYAPTLYAFESGIEYGWFVAKPNAAHQLKKFGIELLRVEARLDIQAISPVERPYYLSHPEPMIYLMHLSHTQRSILPALRGLVRSGKIVFGEGLYSDWL